MPDFQSSPARHMALCLVVRGLLDRLIESEIFGPSDLLAMRDFAVDFADDIGGTIPAGVPDLHLEIKEEVLNLWESLGVPKNLPQDGRAQYT